MKTRKFKNSGLQKMYDLFRQADDETKHVGSAAGQAYRNGLAGFPDRNVATSLGHAAWAAGADDFADRMGPNRNK